MLNLRQSQLQNEFVALNEIRIIFQFAEHTARPKHNQLKTTNFLATIRTTMIDRETLNWPP